MPNSQPQQPEQGHPRVARPFDPTAVYGVPGAVDIRLVRPFIECLQTIRVAAFVRLVQEVHRGDGCLDVEENALLGWLRWAHLEAPWFQEYVLLVLLTWGKRPEEWWPHPGGQPLPPWIPVQKGQFPGAEIGRPMPSPLESLDFYRTERLGPWRKKKGLVPLKKWRAKQGRTVVHRLGWVVRSRVPPQETFATIARSEDGISEQAVRKAVRELEAALLLSPTT